MRNRLAKLREERANGEGGFTLIELLVVVVIIGILIAIAIPLYLNYKKGANDKAAESDLRNSISTLEQCNSDNGAYPTAAFNLSASGAAGSCTSTLNISGGTTFKYTPLAGPPPGYMVTAINSGGSGKTYCYDSTKGGSVQALKAPATTC